MDRRQTNHSEKVVELPQIPFVASLVERGLHVQQWMHDFDAPPLSQRLSSVDRCGPLVLLFGQFLGFVPVTSETG